MKNLSTLLGCLMIFICADIFAQNDPGTKTPKSKSLFVNDSVLNITLYGNIRDLLNDRQENPVYHPEKLIYQNESGKNDTVSVKLKTRGHFRKLSENCIYPPLWLNISDSALQSSIFRKKEKLKLVMSCRDEDYVVREWLVYKLQNIVTPFSLRARLVKLTLKDTKKGKTYPGMYGVLLENENDLAKRNKQTIITPKLNPDQLDRDEYLRMAMFEYLVGNTDWSIQYRQNIILLKKDSVSLAVPVAYDFDHSGMVDAPYALPAEQLQMSSVTERRYRGFCIPDITAYDPYIKEFNDHKNEFYNLYETCPYISDKYKTFVKKFLDGFYNTINDPEKFKKDFLYPCDKNGTGNVIIKGLRE